MGWPHNCGFEFSIYLFIHLIFTSLTRSYTRYLGHVLEKYLEKKQLRKTWKKFILKSEKGISCTLWEAKTLVESPSKNMEATFHVLFVSLLVWNEWSVVNDSPLSCGLLQEELTNCARKLGKLYKRTALGNGLWEMRATWFNIISLLFLPL